MSKYITESINQSGSVGLHQLHTKCLLDDGLRTWPKRSAVSCYCLILLCICSSRSIRQLSQRSNEPLQHHRNRTNLLQNSTHQHIHNITSFNYYVWHALCVCGLRVWGGVYKYNCWIEYIHVLRDRHCAHEWQQCAHRSIHDLWPSCCQHHSIATIAPPTKGGNKHSAHWNTSNTQPTETHRTLSPLKHTHHSAHWNTPNTQPTETHRTLSPLKHIEHSAGTSRW